MTRVTRGELAMLVGQVARIERRLEAIDREGTRGMPTLAAHLADLAASIPGLAEQLQAHQVSHTAEHDRRTAGRRWVIMAIIAVVAIMETPILYIAFKVH